MPIYLEICVTQQRLVLADKKIVVMLAKYGQGLRLTGSGVALELEALRPGLLEPQGLYEPKPRPPKEQEALNSPNAETPEPGERPTETSLAAPTLSASSHSGAPSSFLRVPQWGH